MSLNFKSATIIGCGWFGLALAKALVSQQIKVTGTKRSQQGAKALEQYGIEGVVLDLSDEALVAKCAQEELKADVLIVSIPPGFRRGNFDYLAQLTRLQQLINFEDYQKIVFISSTGVYPNVTGEFDETGAAAYSQSSAILLDAEALFLAHSHGRVCRFAGLVGPNRHPGRFLAGKVAVAGAKASVNLVHQDDCVSAVICVLNAEKSSQIYNVCAAMHPSRQTFYVAAANALSLKPPVFSDELAADKRVKGSRLVDDLGFQYQYSDPLTMLAAC